MSQNQSVSYWVFIVFCFNFWYLKLDYHPPSDTLVDKSSKTPHFLAAKTAEPLSGRFCTSKWVRKYQLRLIFDSTHLSQLHSLANHIQPKNAMGQQPCCLWFKGCCDMEQPYLWKGGQRRKGHAAGWWLHDLWQRRGGTMEGWGKNELDRMRADMVRVW